MIRFLPPTYIYVALTFDDGTIHQYKLARLLSRQGMRCTLFCITHLERHPDTGRRLVVTEPEKIHELYSMGHEIASHTCTHPDLRFVAPKRLIKELGASKCKLETIIGDKVLGFAYPKSQYNANVLERVKKEYYYARCGTDSKDPWNINVHDRYVISSIGVKKAATLPFRAIYRKNNSTPLIVIMMHDISAILLFDLIYYFRTFLKARFVTMTEIAKVISERTNAC